MTFTAHKGIDFTSTYAINSQHIVTIFILNANCVLNKFKNEEKAPRIFLVLPPVAHSPLLSQSLIPFGRSKTPSSERVGPGASVQVR